MFNFDIALSRESCLIEQFGVQARAEAFTVFNDTNFAGAISPAGLIVSLTTMTSNAASATLDSPSRIRSTHLAVRPESCF